MQHAQPPGAQVLERAVDRPQRAVEAQRDRVDGHVAAAQVLVERARPHVGQRARVGVGLGAGAHEVVGAVRRRARARCRSGRGRSTSPPRRAAAASTSPSTTRSSSRGVRSSSRSRTAPPTRCTPSPGAKARSSRAPHGSARSTSMASDASRTAQRYPRGMFPRLRGRWRWLVLGGVCCVVAAGAAVAILVTSQPGDVSHPDVEFTDTQATSPTSTEHKPKATDHPMDDGFAWPDYGYTKARTRYLPLKAPLRPPFVKEWQVSGQPAHRVPARALQALAVHGEEQRRPLQDQPPDRQRALEARSSATWPPRRRRARAPASTRSCSRAARGSRPGASMALDAKNGRVRWSRKLPSRAESSPLVGQRAPVLRHRGRHRLRAAAPATARVRWRYKAAGAVKGGLALDQGRLFFGDYGGQVHAIRQRDGSPIWQTSSAGTRVRPEGRAASTRRRRSAYGRVYIGSLDGFVYSFAASNGKLAWRHKTGNYVYSSPAVASVPGAGPTVYIGSYDGRLYAFDARSGRVRWAHNAGGKISGAPVVVGDLVFYSNLARRSSAAARRRHRQARVGDRPRRLQPGHLRRPAPVLPGLLEPLHARRRRPRRGATSAPATASPAQAGAGAARAKRKADERRAQRCASTAARSRAGWRRGAPRCAATPRLRRQHRAVCFKSHGRTRLPRPAPAGVRQAPRRPHGLPAAQAVERRYGVVGGGWVCAGGCGLGRRRAASCVDCGVGVGAGRGRRRARWAPSSWCSAASSCPAAACRCSSIAVAGVVVFFSVVVVVLDADAARDGRRRSSCDGAADHRAPRDELGQRHDRDADDEGEQAGGDRELPAPAGGALAPVDAHLGEPGIGADAAAAARRPRAAARPRPASRAPAAAPRGRRSSSPASPGGPGPP